MSYIQKKDISNGVYWIEIPEVDLCILCGCPSDSVKHLMKRGIIIKKEKNGIIFESGPNAILLSDVMVQCGNFSNMAEFPVLQMLYKQGMMIPNHPNNTGSIPILIGSREQVDAQMQYIYRGNYGLISKEEIVEAGMSEEMANDMLRMKLKFAFGKIQHTSNFIQKCIVQDEFAEIRNGVFIKRIQSNVFEIQYKEESVQVNLNIQSPYESPYRLGFYNIKRDYFAVIHSGQGDGWNIHKPSMSSILMYQGKIYLIDAGPNIVYILTALGIGINEIEGIFHTHGHDDHFAGITTLIMADHKIKYYATPLVRASVTKKLSALLSIEEEYFSDFFEIHDLNFDVWNQIDGLEVKPLFSPHPLETSIFIFRTIWKDGYKQYAHFADITGFDVMRSMITENKILPGISSEFYHRIKEQYLQKVDLKKIDIGGGMIHGNAKDFKTDESEKIVLAHTSEDLNTFEKEIGSDAQFGSVDVLISSRSNHERKVAQKFLSALYPKLPFYEMDILLNNEFISFNPGTILLKEGEHNENIYLILLGIVEMIKTEDNIYNLLTAGSIIGEISEVQNIPSSETYRTLSYVSILEIPKKLFLYLIEKNNLYENIDILRDNYKLLSRTSLFGEGISSLTQNQLAKSMTKKKYTPNYIFKKNYTDLILIQSGKVECRIGDEIVETLREGDYFGEDIAVFNLPGIFYYVVKEPLEVFEIKGEYIKDIPLVRWKLFERQEKRKSILLQTSFSRNSILQWHDEYTVNIQAMDNHHKNLFQLCENLNESLEKKLEKEYIIHALDYLIEYTESHFSEEEKLLIQYNFPEVTIQNKRHKDIIKKLKNLRSDLDKKELSKDEFVFLMKDWLIDHILQEDRKYTDFLNAKGVF